MSDVTLHLFDRADVGWGVPLILQQSRLLVFDNEPVVDRVRPTSDDEDLVALVD
jgi:hypothetical protein